MKSRRGMRFPSLTALAAAAVTALALSFTLVAPAFADVTIEDQRILTDDPSSVTFEIRVSGDPIQTAFLNYRVLNPDGNVGSDREADVPASGIGTISSTLTTNGPQAYIPIGSLMMYWWELTTTAGEVVTTDAIEFTFVDGRFEWQTVEAEGVTVYWYASAEQAQIALDATVDAIRQAEELLQVELPYPVRVVVWRRSAEGQAAQRGRGGTFDSQVITGGSRVSTDLLHIYDSLSSFSDVARHEAGHLVTKVAGDGTFTRIPSWLDEGVAVYVQESPGVGYESAVNLGAATGNTLRLRNLAAPANRPDQVNLFYGQSWSTVDFMISEWGEDQFARLFATIKRGQPTDAALLEVYGFDQDGLYDRWRAHVGAADPPTPTPTAAPAVVTTPGTDTGSAIPTAAVIVGLVSLLLAAGLGFGAFRLLKAS